MLQQEIVALHSYHANGICDNVSHELPVVKCNTGHEIELTANWGMTQHSGNFEEMCLALKLTVMSI